MEAIDAATLAGTRIELPSPVIEGFASSLDGELIGPDAAGYETAREVWNGMIDRRPALIVRCAGTDDAARAVKFARENGLLVAVRGGGHGVAGHAVGDGALVIDLSAMKQVDVDPDRSTARAEGGCTLGDLDRATQRHGLATPLGVVTRTGIAGLTLSGGMGWLRRKHGLSCDNLVSAQIVTADGEAVTASESQHEDLFWALRGGGGNFGVVTSLEYRLHPVGPEVFFCFAVYPADQAREVLQSCERYLPEAPDIGPLGVLGTVPEAEGFPTHSHGEPYVALLALHPGDPTDGQRVLQPLREIAEPIADFSGPMAYTDAQGLLDEDYPDGSRYYWKSVNIRELSDDAIEKLVECTVAAPSADSTIDVWYQGGAMAQVGESESSFANRAAPYLLGIEGNWEDESTSDANVAWVRDTVAEMSSFSDGGIYLNFPGFLEEGQQLLREGFGGNYDRLVEVKTQYDPGNLFRLNPNIEPAR
jgi:FAD binding domain-containing protein/berberine-like enzyme